MFLKRIVMIFLFGSLIPLSLFSQSGTDRGKNLYELKCGRCHFAYVPQKYSFEEWQTIMTDMGHQSGLTEETENLIMEYLKSESGDQTTGGLPTSPVIAGYTYTEFFAGPARTNTFDIHYLNLAIAGRLHERVSYRAEFEFEHGGGNDEAPFIEWAYIDVWLTRNTGIRIGAIIPPFNRFDDFHAPLENFMITRPQVSREIGVSAWKDVGINLHGSVFLNKDLYINYDAYLINGLGAGSRLRSSRHYRDNNDAKSFGFRVTGIYADQWEAGASYYHGAWDDTGKFDLSMYGLHFLGKISDFNIYAEYSKANSENPLAIDNGDMDGFFIQLSYLYEGKFRPTVRYGNLDYLDLSDQLGRKPTNFDRKTLAIGLNYYLTRAIVFKAEYEIFREGARKADVSNNVLAFQAAVRF